MRRFSTFLIFAGLALGTVMATGCAEHRYQGYDPYYGSYNRWSPGEDYYYRQWLAERRYNYIEYNRLNRERQEEYWEWRNRNARLRENERIRDNGRYVRNDHDRDDRYVARDRDDRNVNRDRDDRYVNRDRDDRNRDRNYSQNRDRDRDRDNRQNHNRDKDREARNRRNDKHRDHDKDGDHDRR